MKQIALAAFMFSCAAAKTEIQKDTKNSLPEKQVLKNILPFDVASCFPKRSQVPVSNTELASGAIWALAPSLQECLVKPSNVEAPLKVILQVNATDSAATISIAGTGLSASGTDCVNATLKNITLGPARKGEVHTTEIPLPPSASKVTFGINGASDAAAQIRQFQPALCECYSGFGSTNPAAITLELETKEKDSMVKITGAGDATACIETKLRTLTFSRNGVKLKMPFLLINSQAHQSPATGPADTVFQALDGQALQRTSDVLMSAGRRALTALDYDEVVKKYKGKPTKGLIEELQTKCPLVSLADDEQLKSLKALENKYSEMVNFAANEKTKNAQWSEAETAVLKKRMAVADEIARVEQQKSADIAACPKVK